MSKGGVSKISKHILNRLTILPRILSKSNLKSILNKVFTENRRIYNLGYEKVDDFDMGMEQASYEEESYSNTNVQVRGVDESDIIKTDGKYIYYINKREVFIIESSGMEIIKKIDYNLIDGRYIPSGLYIDDGKLIGCISTREIKEIPRNEWTQRTIGEIVKPCSCDNTITSDTDAMKALSSMNKTGVSRLLVVDGDRLAGIIALKDLMGFLSLKLDLEEETLGESSK